MILSDNLRKFRRVLQGRGVNLREAMVTGLDGSSIDARVAIANLQDDDVIDSFMNMTDLTDASASIAMERKASVTIFATDKAVKYTARKPGVAGPGSEDIRIKYTDTNVADDPLVVTVSRHVDGYVLIDVQLAQSDVAAITTTAAQARAAVLTEKDASKLVDADLIGTGATLLTASGPHKLGATIAGDVSASVVGYLREQGATAASLVTDLGLDVDDLERDLRYEAVTPGLFGGQGASSPITIEYVDGSNPAETTVAVGPYNDIAVTLREVAGTVLATADEVMAAIRASAEASALVKVRPAHGNPTENAPGVVEAYGPTALDGDEDSGVHVNTDLSAKKILVKWVSRG